MDFTFLETSERTDPGRRRKRNEDSVVRLPDAGVFCVADGIGGAFGGEMASQVTVEKLTDRFAKTNGKSDLETLVDTATSALHDASSTIKREAEEAGALGTGTTVVLMAFGAEESGQAAILHAGDSRAYRFRKGHLSQLTRDHSVASAFGFDADDALPAMFRGVITRALGLAEEAHLDRTNVNVAKGDLFLLCSDGLTRMVPDEKLTRLLAEHTDNDLQALTDKLVDEANAAGGHDNITILLVKVVRGLPPRAPQEMETTRLPARHRASKN